MSDTNELASTEIVETTPTALIPTTDESSQGNPKKRRWFIAGGAAIALALGGMTGAHSRATEIDNLLAEESKVSSQAQTLKEEAADRHDDLQAAKGKIDENKAKKEQLDQQDTDLKAREESQNGRKAELDQLKSSLDSRAQEVSQKEQAAAEAQRAAAEQAAAEAAAKAEQQAQERAASSNSGSGSASVGSRSGSYANCTEARAAGAAPLYRGDPGYSKKLDRDGDGIACEN